MSKRSPNTGKDTDQRGPDKVTKETRKALRQAVKSERRLVEREQAALDKVERTRQGLSEAVERLAKAQERVSRRADRLAEADAELRLRQRERLNGPHHSSVANPYDGERSVKGSSGTGTGKADRTGQAPGQEAASDLGLLPFPQPPANDDVSPVDAGAESRRGTAADPASSDDEEGSDR